MHLAVLHDSIARLRVQSMCWDGLWLCAQGTSPAATRRLEDLRLGRQVRGGQSEGAGTRIGQHGHGRGGLHASACCAALIIA
eukprot:365445-Chlamydomonas_euryale.AAC.20